jgi:hypothetical protein
MEVRRGVLLVLGSTGVKARRMSWRHMACSPHEFSVCRGRWDRNRTGNLRIWRWWRCVLERPVPFLCSVISVFCCVRCCVLSRSGRGLCCQICCRKRAVIAIWHVEVKQIFGFGGVGCYCLLTVAYEGMFARQRLLLCALMCSYALLCAPMRSSWPMVVRMAVKVAVISVRPRYAVGEL